MSLKTKLLKLLPYFPGASELSTIIVVLDPAFLTEKDKIR